MFTSSSSRSRMSSSSSTASAMRALWHVCAPLAPPPPTGENQDMRAAVMRNAQLVVDTVRDPEPGPGEVLVKTLACGICGSDLHALMHADKMVEAAKEGGAPFTLDPSRDVVMGHEFCAD